MTNPRRKSRFRGAGTTPHGRPCFAAPVGRCTTADPITPGGVRPFVKVCELDELRRHGVTLHLRLDNERQPIHDVPAVYFVRPNAHNVARISADFAAGLYEAYHLNFSSSLPRPMLEDLVDMVGPHLQWQLSEDDLPGGDVTCGNHVTPETRKYFVSFQRIIIQHLILSRRFLRIIDLLKVKSNNTEYETYLSFLLISQHLLLSLLLRE